MADDEPANLDLIRMIVEDWGLAVSLITAVNGAEAVTRARAHGPDLVDLLLLPPVFEQFAHAHREVSRRQPGLRNRRDGQGIENGPNVSFRWRSRSDPPAGVGEKMAAAR